MSDDTDMVVEGRRRLLREWIDSRYGGVQAAFIDDTGVNQGELSGLLKSKSFGEKRARSLEIKARMPRFYLDQSQRKAEETAADSHSHSMRLDPVMLSQTYKALLTLDPVADHPISLANLDDAAHFVQVYEMRATMPIHPSEEEWVEFGRKLAMLTPTGGDDGRGGGAVPVKGADKGKMAGKVRRKA